MKTENWLQWFTFVVFCLINILYVPSTMGASSLSDDDELIDEPFVATHEWQRIKPGQAIPPGLHVKMDMTQGGSWAKLMDDDNKSTSQLQVLPQKELEAGSPKNETVSSYKIEELKAALKNFKNEKENNITSNKDEVKKKFRSIEEIRETFDQLNLHEESDVSVMKRMVTILLNDNKDDDAKLTALQDLEYYVHQIDNANDLVAFGGFEVVLPFVNNSNPLLREEAIHVIGSAMQSNPKVQIKAIESGVLQLLLHLIMNQSEEFPVRKKCLYALSALLRHFPLAQLKFTEHGGFYALIQLFHQKDATSLQFKALRLLNDLVVERRDAETSNDPGADGKRKQYNRIPMDEVIQKLGWCYVPTSLLPGDSHGDRETILISFNNLHPYCSKEFQEEDVVNALKKLKDFYEKLQEAEDKISSEEKETYFNILFGMAKSALKQSRTKDEL